jgi:hypothetical protein
MMATYRYSQYAKYSKRPDEFSDEFSDEYDSMESAKKKKKKGAPSVGSFDCAMYRHMAYFMAQKTVAMLQSTCTTLREMRLKLKTCDGLPIWSFNKTCEKSALSHARVGPQPIPKGVRADLTAFKALATLELQHAPRGYWSCLNDARFPNLTELDISNQPFCHTNLVGLNTPQLAHLTMNNMKAQEGAELSAQFGEVKLETLCAHGLDFRILEKKRVPSHITKFPLTLTSLDLTRAKLDASSLICLERLINLRALRLNSSKNFDPMHLAGLVKLNIELLDLDHLPMTYEAMAALSHMRALLQLSIFNVKHLSQLLLNRLPRSLHVLSIGASQNSDNALRLELPPDLTTLTLWCKGEVFMPHKALPSVTSLTLCSLPCRPDEMAALFAKLPALTHLTLFRAVGVELILDALNAAGLNSITFQDCGFLEECGLLEEFTSSRSSSGSSSSTSSDVPVDMSMSHFKANLMVPNVQFVGCGEKHAEKDLILCLQLRLMFSL